MNIISKICTVAAVATALTVSAMAPSFAYDEDDYDSEEGFYENQAYHGPNNNFAEGQNPSGNHRPGCVRDFWNTSDCGPDSNREFGPYDGQHSMERGDQIQF
jgi:hypothetical protein